MVAISAAPGAGKSYFLDQIAKICSPSSEDLNNYFTKKNIHLNTKQLCSDLGKYCEKIRVDKYETMYKILQNESYLEELKPKEEVTLYDELIRSFNQFKEIHNNEKKKMWEQFLLQEFRSNLEHSVSISITFNSGWGVHWFDANNPSFILPLRILYRFISLNLFFLITSNKFFLKQLLF